MFKTLCIFLLGSSLPLAARETPAWPVELAAYQLTPAPTPDGLKLHKGDRLAICGDSITEQKQYSLAIEAYLACCLPELEIACRQFGWSGEQVAGFLNRLENDVLRFKPNIATTCYGMNDFRYVPFDESIATEYRKNQTEVVRVFKESGCRVILGSSGIIDSVPHWVKNATGTKEDLNLALSKFRNITLEVAMTSEAGFADVYQPMLLADLAAKQRFGPDFKVAGKDGVHPGWAGQIVMAYAFLKALGIDGDIGTITWDAASGRAAASAGHEVLSSTGGRLALRSSKLPFSPGPGDPAKDDSIRAGLGLVPFDQELNRFVLKITSPAASAYTVTWGEVSNTYPAAELAAGVSLARDFDKHPLVPAFKAVWDAVAAKQAYETRQIKTLVHGPEGLADMEATFALTEKTRARLVEDLRKTHRPVDHELLIVPVE
ncbi:MAG: SGNH/GDSL hydrolase family protein [Luteolibacter sp.]|jgi:lysophospholipase L1-like esterase|nr:SGNH/GDSL hydrolase family protein [Luteolibacter sp.]